MSTFYSILYSLIIGCFFVYIFIYTYDFFYGEKQEKQIKRLHKYFRNETIKKVDLIEHEPRKYTRYNVVTTNGVHKIRMKPGYKVVKIVAPKNGSAKSSNLKRLFKK